MPRNDRSPARPSALIALTLTALCACSANYPLRVVSNPPSAVVYVNGEQCGVTPITVILPFDESPRAFIQVAHPQRQSRMLILKEDTVPPDGEQAFDLPVGS